MNIKECYELMHGDYNDAKNRLMSDRLIEKFMLKFPQDGSMQQLEEALKAEDYELAFRSAHTLKGVAANLAFSALFKAASDLTERLRYDKSAPDQALVQKVEEEYDLVIATLKNYSESK